MKKKQEKSEKDPKKSEEKPKPTSFWREMIEVIRNAWKI
jgi:hypothetical protein